MTDLILISHKSGQDLERFLPSIKKYTDPKDYTLTIVDNDSDKHTKRYLKECGEKVIFNEKNVGYGVACNIGAKATNSEFIVFLNCDLSAQEGWLEELLKPFENKKVAISGARLYAMSGEEWPTPTKGWVCGAVLAMRRSVFDELGGFDENFFLFYEESDFCRRCLDKGYKVIRSEAKLVHYHPHFPPLGQQLQEHWEQSKAHYKKKFNILPKVLIAVPCYREMQPLFVESLIRLLKMANAQEQYDFDFMFLYETVIYEVRENAVSEAIKREADYILFVDNDAVFPADAVMKLLKGMEEKQADVVAGLFFKRVPPFAPTSLLKLVIDKSRSGEVVFKALPEWREGLVEIDGCGMHFTLIRTEVFNRMKPPYFFVTKGVGEDLWFCFKAKTEAKAKLYCDTRVRIEHLATIPVGEATFREFQEQADKEKLEEIKKIDLSKQ